MNDENHITVRGAVRLLSNSMLRKAVNKLRKANAPTFDDGHYHAVVHPDLIKDLDLGPGTINHINGGTIVVPKVLDEMGEAVEKWNQYYNNG